MKKQLIFKCCFLIVFLITCRDKNSINEDDFYKISVSEYQDKVYSAWIGQIIGNLYGLPHEGAYIDSPGPDIFPLGYKNIDKIRELKGAWSDDDTDLEYMYLLMMEKYGVEPGYKDIVKTWKHHIKESIWLANRAALAMMQIGYTPPYTGDKRYNPHWFQIDPQLINEIWAITAPGMIKYAVDKSDWAARVTSDDWGVEPTICYGAMFSAAFFENDVNKLIDIGSDALPGGSRFKQTINDMKLLYGKYPDDWKKARKEMAEKYFINEPIETKTEWNANLNGACGILALLYGEGDFQKTLDMAAVLGFDADNQTATMCGLIGIINGIDGIPNNLLMPVEEWKEPFNDKYYNLTRFDLPDVSIKNMAERTAAVGEEIILKHGGKKITENNTEYFLINKNAVFNAPFEFSKGPEPIIEINKPVEFEFLVSGGDNSVKWKIIKGELPEGLIFKNGRISGVTNKTGIFNVVVEAIKGNQQITDSINIRVRSKNIASEATRILASVQKTNTSLRDSLWLSVPFSLFNDNVNIISDGRIFGDGSVFYSIKERGSSKKEFYGYEWNQEQEISLISFHTGSMEEMGGWFSSLDVQYQNNNGNWQNVSSQKITPDFSYGNNIFEKPHFIEYLISFESIKTKAVRIIGDSGGIRHYRNKYVFFTSITELGVYKE